MNIKINRLTLISGIIAFILVFGSWMCDKWIFEGNSYLGFLFAIIWWLPGFLILSIFNGSWAVIHLDRWISLTPVISFLFWIAVLLVIRKLFIVRDKKNNTKQVNPSKSNEERHN
jgi:hypothetical protein